MVILLQVKSSTEYIPMPLKLKRSSCKAYHIIQGLGSKESPKLRRQIHTTKPILNLNKAGAKFLT